MRSVRANFVLIRAIFGDDSDEQRKGRECSWAQLDRFVCIRAVFQNLAQFGVSRHFGAMSGDDA
jgi:hypothetical protein